MRIRHHNDYWGPFGRNVPEDAFAAEACEKAFGSGAARYQIIARDENGQGQDDLMLRAYYQAWADMTGRPHHNPANE
jgi:methanesulfonate monooxygenase large subunit